MCSPCLFLYCHFHTPGNGNESSFIVTNIAKNTSLVMTGPLLYYTALCLLNYAVCLSIPLHSVCSVYLPTYCLFLLLRGDNDR
ncbi:hypothetical protein BDF14DRAFT_1839839 [Spinellus fusiger]|nr:hypothetical protein BDF14DRAFT_1839839 [Spinellus fusiger]